MRKTKKKTRKDKINTIRDEKGDITTDTAEKRIYNGKEVYEKMLNIFDHQRNANQNYNDISSYLSKNGFYPKTGNSKCWQGCGEEGALSYTVGGDVKYNHYG